MTEYRRPFLKREERWPMLTWPRQIPIGGSPADVVAIVDTYAKWMAENEIPKLFVNAEPGAILTGATREFCRTWESTEVSVVGDALYPGRLRREDWINHCRMDENRARLKAKEANAGALRYAHI